MSATKRGCLLLLALSALVVPDAWSQADGGRSERLDIERADRDFCRAVSEDNLQLLRTLSLRTRSFTALETIGRSRWMLVGPGRLGV